MNKRSAMTIAAGLVFALMVGVAAVAMGATGPDPAGGGNEAQTAQQPHVRTITRTVEVQPRSDDPAAPDAPATDAPGQSSSQGSYDDDRWDDHGDDDDDDRRDDHGDDDDDDRWDDHGDDDDDGHGDD